MGGFGQFVGSRVDFCVRHIPTLRDQTFGRSQLEGGAFGNQPEYRMGFQKIAGCLLAATSKNHLLQECTFHPASPYAISKVGTDLIGRYHAEAYKQKIITTRMFTHTGPRRGDVFAESTFAKQIAMIELGLIKPVIKVGNLESLRTFADVRDAVRAYHMMLTISPIIGEYYNIGGTHVCSIGDMLDTLLGQSSVNNIQIEVDPERIRPIDADLQIPDTSKFTKKTGWKPEISFEKTMLDLLEYWRKRTLREGQNLIR